MVQKKLNVKLLRKVQKAILKEPKRMNMEEWIDLAEDYQFEDYKAPACGTVGCIAGWAVILDQKPKKSEIRQVASDIPRYSVDDQATKLLGLNEDEANDLFLPSYWPQKYSDRLEKQAPGTKKYAQVVSDRIDHFIKTGK